MTMRPTPPGLFVGKGPVSSHRHHARRALIRRRHRAWLRRVERNGPTIEHAGDPDHDLAQLPDGLVGR